MVNLNTLKAMHAKVQAASSNQPPRSALVVGGTSGIGHGIALTLAKYNYNVAIAGRNAEAGAKVVDEMKALNKNEYTYLPLDASLLSNCSEFGKDYSKNHDKLDVLVLTQGIASINGFTPTSEGYDQKVSLHYLSRMALIKSLLGSLNKSDSPRVLSVLSAGVHGVYANYKDDFLLEKSFSIKNAADAAGLYNDCGLDSLAQENPKIAFIHAAPGFVNTNWGSGFPVLLKWLTRAVQPLGRTIEDCGEYMAHPLLLPKEESKPGFTLIGPDADPAKKTSVHEEARKIVWEKTVTILKKYGL